MISNENVRQMRAIQFYRERIRSRYEEHGYVMGGMDQWINCDVRVRSYPTKLMPSHASRKPNAGRSSTNQQSPSPDDWSAD